MSLGLRRCGDLEFGKDESLSSPKGGEDSIRRRSSFGVLLALTLSPTIFHLGLDSLLLLYLPRLNIKCARSVEMQSKTAFMDPYNYMHDQGTRLHMIAYISHY